MIHEVRVYKGDGKLKQVISAKTANDMFWAAEGGAFTAATLRQVVCKRCKTLFETKDRRKALCTIECAYQWKIDKLKIKPLAERTCDWCEQAYVPKALNNRFCNPKCTREGVFHGVPIIMARREEK